MDEIHAWDESYFIVHVSDRVVVYYFQTTDLTPV